MNRLLTAIACFIFCFTTVYGQTERPKLVVGIVVDQMRPDYLYRFNSEFGNDGFKRLMREGFEFKNMHYNYMPTYTAPGHSSIYTGTTPAIHGIVGNSWFHKSENTTVYCTADDSVDCVGMEENHEDGKMSPRRLKASTITDELKLYTNSRAKVYGISLKDRGAILPAGHLADGAFWMNDNGKFITSSYYKKPMPNWVKDYNEQNQAEQYIAQGWDLSKPKSAYDESFPDDNPYERVFEPKKFPTFPYDLSAIAKKEGDLSIIKTTPYGNTMVEELAEKAITNAQLGADNITDFLAVSFSSTDYAGHNFGPRSVEVEDMYIRLDKTLAQFFNFLDKTVGKGNYLLFLTADHAAADNPASLYKMGYQVDDLNRKKIKGEIEDFVSKKYGDSLFVNYYNQNIFLNENYIAKNKLNYDDIVRDVQNFMMTKDYVYRAYTRNDILLRNTTDYILKMVSKGYDPKQNGDLVVVFNPQNFEGYGTGTTHGSPFSYDTHVPNLWMGWGIKPGYSTERKFITEVAPTLSMLLNIPFPNGSECVVMQELLQP